MTQQPRDDMPYQEHMFDKFGVELKKGDILCVAGVPVYEVAGVDHNTTLATMIGSSLPASRIYTAWPFEVQEKKQS